MAVGHNELTLGDNGGVGSDSYFTASITPTTDRLILCSVFSYLISGPPDPPTLSGNSVTWVQVSSQAMRTGTQGRLSIFRAMGIPTTGSINIDFAGVSQSQCLWGVVEFSGVTTTGANGADAVGNTTSGGFLAGTGATLTLPAFGSVNNATLGVLAQFSSSSFANGSGFTQLQHQDVSGVNHVLFDIEWRVDNDTTVDWTWIGSSEYTAIALELVAGTAFDTTTGIPWQQVGGEAPVQRPRRMVAMA